MSLHQPPLAAAMLLSSPHTPTRAGCAATLLDARVCGWTPDWRQVRGSKLPARGADCPPPLVARRPATAIVTNDALVLLLLTVQPGRLVASCVWPHAVRVLRRCAALEALSLPPQLRAAVCCRFSRSAMATPSCSTRSMTR